MLWQLQPFGFKYFILARKLWLIYFSSVVQSGCALHYYDTESGAEHIYGFGYLVMKAPPPQSGQRALMKQTHRF